VFLAIDKPRATALWATVTGIMLLIGFIIAKKRSPELKQIEQGDTEMDLILHLAEAEEEEVHLFFRRSKETDKAHLKQNEAYITFYSPRVGGIPPKVAANHFRLPLTKVSLYHRIVSVLKIMEYEMGDRKVVVHFGWPMSSWLDRLSIGVMVYNLIKLPGIFLKFHFLIEYNEDWPVQTGKTGK
jgi:hypothetical protein